ncbi:MAG: EamA family transporter [Desulfurococcales archaeon]|nr:EamA family transporter [Desulfurococcales archaeon]
MEKWLVYSMTTLILWGIWGILLKKASEGLEWFQVYVFANTAIVLMVVIVATVYRGEMMSYNNRIYLPIAFVSGLVGTLGYIFLIKSLEAGGEASVVIPLTSLYPLLTALFSVYLLGEELTIRRIYGILLAVLAIILLSAE